MAGTGLSFGIFRQQQPGGKLPPILHRDPGDLDVFDLVAAVDDLRSLANHVASPQI